MIRVVERHTATQPIRFADEAAIQQAATVIQSGGLVAFPTETVYGLGADATNSSAVAKVFEVKGRPLFDPLIVHVASQHEACSLWIHCPPMAQKLMESFWPGPLTLVLPKRGCVPDLVTAGFSTVALRMPDHPMALELIRQAGCPIAAPSANRFGRPSPTTARAVREELGSRMGCVLDGGPAPLGIESTVIGFDGSRAVLLRPGGLPAEAIERLLRCRLLRPRRSKVAGSPGRLERHYAPATPLYLLRENGSPIRPIGRSIAWQKVGLLAWKPTPLQERCAQTELLSRRGDLREAAVRFFEALRRLDAAGLEAVVALLPPPNGLGLAIRDRLQRGASGQVVGGFGPADGEVVVRSW